MSNKETVQLRKRANDGDEVVGGEEGPEEKKSNTSTALFRYTNSLDRPYNDRIRSVKSATFDIGRYGNVTHSIDFPDGPVSEAAAIAAIEAWLSAPLSVAEYEVLRNAGDLFHYSGDDPFPTDGYLVTRGDCLGDCRFLESITISRTGHLTFFCGS
jgi:hypothetical protein